jgi:hypothetical protein
MTDQARLEKMRLMLKALLVDRFKLVVRKETSELPIYTVLVGKGGPKLEKRRLTKQSVSQASRILARFAIPAKAEDRSDAADLPTLFTVFETQGLKLEPQKDRVDIFRIERVARPSQN